MEFDMVILFVSDMAKSLEFYVNGMGFELKSHKTIFDAARDPFVVLEGYGLKLALHSHENPPVGGSKLVFNVDDLDRCYEFFKDRGVYCSPKMEVAPNIYEVEVKDPDGHLLSFISYG